MALLTIDDLMQARGEDNGLVDIAHALSKMYEDFLDTDEGEQHERPPGLHASEISGCLRKPVYTLTNTEKRGSSNGMMMSDRVWKRRFKIGHAVHDMFQKDFERMTKRPLHEGGYRLSFQKEFAINPTKGMLYSSKWDIYSHCDGIFVISDANGTPLIRIAIEIKTMSPDDYEKLTKPKDEHVEQAHVYMACIDVPFTWFIYYNKGNQNYTSSNNPSFFIKFDPKKWEELEARFETFHTHAALKTLPDRQEGVVCEFCPYAWTCQPKYLTRKQGFRNLNPKWSP